MVRFLFFPLVTKHKSVSKVGGTVLNIRLYLIYSVNLLCKVLTFLKVNLIVNFLGFSNSALAQSLPSTSPPLYDWLTVDNRRCQCPISSLQSKKKLWKLRTSHVWVYFCVYGEVCVCVWHACVCTCVCVHVSVSAFVSLCVYVYKSVFGWVCVTDQKKMTSI